MQYNHKKFAQEFGLTFIYSAFQYNNMFLFLIQLFSIVTVKTLSYTNTGQQ